MRALLQRVTRAAVDIDGRRVGEIGGGLLVLVCAMQGDTEADAAVLAGKIVKLRIFADDQGRMNRSVLDVGGKILAVSQFTLAADTSRGNRPGFSRAAPPEEGLALYERFCDQLRAGGLDVETGEFGADMAVSLVNDGPVTIWLDTAER
jgi:D-tyrosyl-tRNA(Tyr) deacylase